MKEFHYNTGSTVSGHDSKSLKTFFYFVPFNLENDGSCLNHGFLSFRVNEEFSFVL